MVEICAGSAQLACSFKRLGFNTLPFDCSRNRHQTKTTVYQLDLSLPSSAEVLTDLLSDPSIAYVHFAPPCGTSSKARERPVPFSLRQQGAPEPRPLRSSLYPKGLPGLTPSEQMRVSAANAIYELVIHCVYVCFRNKIPLSVENPPTSYFWEYPGMEECKIVCNLEDVQFHGCMHGGSRARLCRWRATKGMLEPLAVLCDKSHQHKPWTMNRIAGVWNFSTAEEAAYPATLTDKVAVLVSDFVQFPLQLNASLDDQRQSAALAAVQTGKQPRGNKVAHLISEYKEVIQCSVKDMPSDAKILRNIPDGADGSKMVIAGIFRSHYEYIDEARTKLHPMDSVDMLDETHRQTISFVLQKSPLQISKFRLDQLSRANQMAKDLEQQEKLLHEQMEPNVARVLKGKRLLLFKQLLLESGFPEAEQLVAEMSRGFDLVGKTSTSGCLDKLIRPATTAVSDLAKSSVWNRKALSAKCRSTGNCEDDLSLWNDTLDEVQKGWLRGPFSENEVSEHLGTSNWLCARRFPITQGPKTRLIDDCREPQLNTALCTTEKLGLMSVDHFSILAIQLAAALRDSSTHPDWKNESFRFQGRTLDLKSAYKNLACSPSTRWCSVIVSWNPFSKIPAYFISDALMFGSTAAVYAFNRCARGLWFLATVWLRVFVTQFYDDFPSIEFGPLTTGARNSFEGLLALLGWPISSTEGKVFPFSSSFKMLGVVASLDSLAKGTLTISNTESRVQEICKQIDSICNSGTLSPAVAATLFGRLGFAMTSVFGRGCTLGIRFLSKAAAGKDNLALTNEHKEALGSIRFFLEHSRPRSISLTDDKVPILVFTDAAAQDQSASYGILFIDKQVRLIAGSSIPQALVQKWLKEVGSQIICQAELYPILLAKLVWNKQMSGRRVLFFIDNEPSRFALIKAESDSGTSRKIIKQFYMFESCEPSVMWFARVPSLSNPADLPSRGDVQLAARMFSAQITDLTAYDKKLIDLCG